MPRKSKTHSEPKKKVSHMTPAAWLAVCAIAISSVVISDNAVHAASDNTQRRQDPMSAVIQKLNAVQAQNARIEATVNRIEETLSGSAQSGQDATNTQDPGSR